MGLETIRENIDSVDTQMRELFLKRMDLSRQVIEEKKKTGGSVYVPEREAEVIARRLERMPEEFSPEYKMFLKQVMVVSRIYQYSRLNLPGKNEKAMDVQGEFEIQFTCRQQSDQLSGAVTALKLAGITIRQMYAEEKEKGKLFCRLTVSGDFRQDLAKGAVLLICQENEDVSVERMIDE